MKAVNTEDFKDRTDRTVVSPWIKFLWDTHRNVLEYLKVSPALENKYHEVAQRTSRFCKTYKKKTELKNLTTLLKQHLTALKLQIGDAEVARVSNKVSLNNLETVNQNIETRFKHLKVAIALDLWQDAYKTIEDIHYLVELAKEGVKDQHLESYYELLARTFLVSKNFLLHACAYYKLFKFSLVRNKEESQIRFVASSLLLATLAIPSSKRAEADEQLGDITEMDFLEREKLSKMSALLGLPVASSKQNLIEELKRDNISQYVYPELRNLTTVLAGDFDPFAIGPEISNVLEFLKPSEEAKAAEQDKSLKKLRVYGKSLRSAALSLLLDQLSKVYSVIRIEELISMAPKGTTLESLERVLVDALQQRSLLVTIDHQAGVIYFNKGQSTLDSEAVRRELINFAKKLRICSKLIHREELAQKREARRKVLSQLTQKSEAENRALLERQQWLEKKREWEGRQKIKLQEEIAARAKEEAAKRAAEEEKRRIEEEKRIQEQKQKLAEAQQKKQLAEQFVKAIEKTTETKSAKKAAAIPAVTINTDEITGEEDLVASVDAIVEAQKSKIEKAKKEKEKKLAELARQYDFLERARREAEIPLLKQDYENQKKLDKKLFEEEERRLRDVAAKQAEQLKQEKQRVERFSEDKAEFLKQFITPKRTALFNQKKAEQEKRREELYADWEKRRTLIMEEIQKREEAKKKREEERRKREEERKEEARKREEEEKKKAEQAAKQIAKQREIEDRLAQQQQELASKAEKKPASRWGSLGGESGAAPSAGTGRTYASRFGDSRPTFTSSKKPEEPKKTEEAPPKEPEAPQRRSYVPKVGAASQIRETPESKEEETEYNGTSRGTYSSRGGYGGRGGYSSNRGGRTSSAPPKEESVDEEGFQTVTAKSRGGRRGGR